MDCEFCRIIERKAPADVVFEDERVIIFKDYRPQANIHLLVCPKTHIATFLDAPTDVIAELFAVCRRLAKKLKVESGFKLVIHNGPQGGQIIYHLHIHFLSWIKSLEQEKIELNME